MLTATIPDTFPGGWMMSGPGRTVQLCGALSCALILICIIRIAAADPPSANDSGRVVDGAERISESAAPHRATPDADNAPAAMVEGGDSGDGAPADRDTSARHVLVQTVSAAVLVTLLVGLVLARRNGAKG